MMPCSRNGLRTKIGVTDAKFTHKTAQNNLLGPQNALAIFKIIALNMALWPILHVCTISSDVLVIGAQRMIIRFYKCANLISQDNIFKILKSQNKFKPYKFIYSHYQHWAPEGKATLTHYLKSIQSGALRSFPRYLILVVVCRLSTFHNLKIKKNNYKIRLNVWNKSF